MASQLTFLHQSNTFYSLPIHFTSKKSKCYKLYIVKHILPPVKTVVSCFQPELSRQKCGDGRSLVTSQDAVEPAKLLAKTWNSLNAFVTRVDALGLGQGKENMARAAGMAGHVRPEGQVFLVFSFIFVILYYTLMTRYLSLVCFMCLIIHFSSKRAPLLISF